jgi:hypothetical protein
MSSQCRTTPIGAMCVPFSTTGSFTGPTPAVPHGMLRKTSRFFSKGVAIGPTPSPAPVLADSKPRQKSRFFDNGVFKHSKQLPSPESEDEPKASTAAPTEHVANLKAVEKQLGSEVQSPRPINRAACTDADRLRSRVAELQAAQAKSEAYQAILEAILANYTRSTGSSRSDSLAPQAEQSRPHQQHESLLINGALLGRFMGLDEFIAASSGTAPVMETGRHCESSRSSTVVPQTCDQGRDSAFSEGPNFGRPMSFDEFALLYGTSTTRASALSTEMGRYPGVLAPKPIHPRAPLLNMTDF